MFFQKKIDKSMEWLKNKNKKDTEISYDEPFDPKAEYEEENPIDLEKGDILALFLSALLVFSPIIIIIILVIIWTLN